MFRGRPGPLRPVVCIISGFITVKGRVFVRLQRRNAYFDIQLHRHVVEAIGGKEAMRGNTTRETVIVRVHASKGASLGPSPEAHQNPSTRKECWEVF